MERPAGFTDLMELQAVDADVDKLLEDRRNLPELAEHAQARRIAEEKERAHDALADQKRILDRDVSRTEGELEVTEQKLKEQERRLFAGAMSARETENMRMEVGGLRRQVTVMEDELLELLDQSEGLAEEERTSGEQAGSAREYEVRLAARIDEIQAAVDASVERLRERRRLIVPSIGPELLKLYGRLRERRGGIVVGEVSGRVCGACHLQMSVAEFEEVTGDAIPQCIHCAAVLVV